jgi:AraC-like DNA-binding protein
MYQMLVPAEDVGGMEIWSTRGPEVIDGLRGVVVHLFDLRYSWSVRFATVTTALLITIPCDAIAVANPSRRGAHPFITTPAVHDVQVSIVQELVSAAMAILAVDSRGGLKALEHVVKALLTNVCAGYCSYRVHPRASCERLAPWQEQRIRDYVAHNLTEKIRAAELSRRCGISCSHFSRLFKNTLGVTLRQWVIEQRVEHAKHLLLASNAPIADVANEAGFADQAHFSRIFSKKTHCSPLAWRRSRRALTGPPTNARGQKSL